VPVQDQIHRCVGDRQLVRIRGGEERDSQRFEAAAGHFDVGRPALGCPCMRGQRSERGQQFTPAGVDVQYPFSTGEMGASQIPVGPRWIRAFDTAGQPTEVPALDRGGHGLGDKPVVLGCRHLWN
jgi:hypothetical protein